MRFGSALLVQSLIVLTVILLAEGNSGFRIWLQSGVQYLPQPANNIFGAELALSLALGLAADLLFFSKPQRVIASRPRRTTWHSTSRSGPGPGLGDSRVPRSSLPSFDLKGWKPLPPMIKYFGGKSRIATKIVARIPSHKTWVEPFAGGASVTLAKPPSPKEVLADKRADLVRFYHAIKTGKKFSLPPGTKAVFNRIRAKPEYARSPGEFVRLQGNSFGGHAQSFAAGSGTSGTMLNKRLPAYSERLKATSVINSDYASTIRRYDSPKTTFYLDPPYPQDKKHYTDYGRTIPNAQDVKKAVEHVRGKVLISYPNVPSVRDAFPPPHWRNRDVSG